MFQQRTSNLRSLLISGHLKCPQVNFILEFDSGYEGSTLLDVLLVFFYFEKQERVISPSGHAGRWRWAMGEGISGRGAGIRRCALPGARLTDGRRVSQGSFWGESWSWAMSSPSSRGPPRRQERRGSAGASARVLGHRLACTCAWTSPLLPPHLHPPHKVVTGTSGKWRGKENDQVLERGRMANLSPS